MSLKTKILVTGGAGFIGSHLVNSLLAHSYEVVVLDNLSTGFRESLSTRARFFLGDVTDSAILNKIFLKYNFDVVIHLAGVLNIAESFKKESFYDQVNVHGTENIVRMCIKYKVDKLIFSSSCTVYGQQTSNSLAENLPCDPISPYGMSKKKCENLLQKTKDIRHLVFRYFNVAGALSDKSNGQRTKKVSQLIHKASKAAVGKVSSVDVCGFDYKTFDGTNVRDYIHIEDLIRAHILGLRYLIGGGASQILNCGSGVGHSVMEVLNETRKLAKNPFEIVKKERRPGDPDYLVSDNSKIRSTLQWEPTRSDIGNILKSAIAWEQKLIQS